MKTEFNNLKQQLSLISSKAIAPIKWVLAASIGKVADLTSSKQPPEDASNMVKTVFRVSSAAHGWSESAKATSHATLRQPTHLFHSINELSRAVYEAIQLKLNPPQPHQATPPETLSPTRAVRVIGKHIEELSEGLHTLSDEETKKIETKFREWLREKKYPSNVELSDWIEETFPDEMGSDKSFLRAALEHLPRLLNATKKDFPELFPSPPPVEVEKPVALPTKEKWGAVVRRFVDKQTQIRDCRVFIRECEARIANHPETSLTDLRAAKADAQAVLDLLTGKFDKKIAAYEKRVIQLQEIDQRRDEAMKSLLEALRTSPYQEEIRKALDNYLTEKDPGKLNEAFKKLYSYADAMPNKLAAFDALTHFNTLHLTHYYAEGEKAEALRAIAELRVQKVNAQAILEK